MFPRISRSIFATLFLVPLLSACGDTSDPSPSKTVQFWIRTTDKVTLLGGQADLYVKRRGQAQMEHLSTEILWDFTTTIRPWDGPLPVQAGDTVAMVLSFQKSNPTWRPGKEKIEGEIQVNKQIHAIVVLDENSPIDGAGHYFAQVKFGIPR